MNIKHLPLALLALSMASPAALRASGEAPKYHLIHTYRVPGDGGWDYLEADAASQRLYIARGTHVQVVSTVTGKLVGDIPGTAGVHGVALSPLTGTGFASCGRSNSVTVFNLKSLKKTATVAVGQRPDAIIYDQATKRIFTMNAGSNNSTAIDTKTRKVAGTIALGGRPEYAVADGLGHVYVNLEDKSAIVELNSKTLKIMHTWPLAPGTGPSGLAMDIQHRRLFSVCDNNKMVIMNADTGKKVAMPKIGSGPDACKFDPAYGIAFSPNGEDGTLTVVHEETPNTFSISAKAGTIKTQDGARTMSLDTSTHHVFLVAAKEVPAAPGTPAPPEGSYRRPGYVPGTFVVLEFAP